MPCIQPDLFALARKSLNIPSVPSGDVATLIAVLSGTTRRMTAEEICEGVADPRWDKRRVRAAAEASHGKVLSAPGCPGYRLADQTSVKSYYENERRCYKSQIRRMELRLAEMDKAVHGCPYG